jgi:hypothetical protein
MSSIELEIFPPAGEFSLRELDEFIWKLRERGHIQPGIVVSYNQYNIFTQEMSNQMRWIDVGQESITKCHLVIYMGFYIIPTSFDRGYISSCCDEPTARAIYDGHRVTFCCRDHVTKIRMLSALGGE